MASTEPSSDPAAELLALEREKEARRERRNKEIRYTVALLIVMTCVIFALLAYLNS